MADNYNSMQANLGLIPGVGPQVQVKSPAQAAAELSQQASMQMQSAMQMNPVARGSAASFTFGQQYQQQFQAAQAQSSMSPYAAGMMGSFVQPSALPSPLMMTPASTGVFRPPMPYGSGAGGSPMSPMPVMPMFQTPFTPQMPTPNFRTPWEQEIQQRELRADQLYSMVSQAPRFGGQAAGYGMGALAGAALGSRFGAVGRGAGAVLGGILSHYSGFAEGMGSMAMAPFRPGREAHEMGLSVQRMSQDWVVGGPNLHELGRGLSRDASMYVGQGIQRLAESQSFKNETRGMFNRHDLTQIMQKSGQAGLMDFDQGVDRIQEQLRKVSRTVSRFMELTNDPDVTSVIKRMGQMHTFGLSVPEIEGAASSMRAFSRAAGTTVGGLYQQGLPGAMTYQGLGLSGGAGLQYGMYSAASARQAVASGTFSNAELAMFGGVQGVAQRNMQAQGAFMSMPMFGASISSYGAGGWGMNAGALARMGGGGAGPQGMVMGAVSNMNAAVGAGGIGALAMMPLQQRQIQDQAARTMTPYEQTAMRFSMAADTGKFLGLKGAGGFAAGARMLYGDEVATQMMTEAANPAYWRAQKAMIRQERDDIARSQRQEIMDAAPGIGAAISGAIGRPFAAVGDMFSKMGARTSRGWRNAITRPLQEAMDRESGVITYDSLDPELRADLSSREGRAAFKSKSEFGAAYGRKRTRTSGDEATLSGQQAYDMMWRAGAGEGWSAGAQNITNMAGAFVPYVGQAAFLIDEFTPLKVGSLLQTGIGNAYLAMSGKEGKALMRQMEKSDLRMTSIFGDAASRNLQSSGKVFSTIEKTFGLKAGEGMWAMVDVGKAVGRAAGAEAHWYGDGALTESTTRSAVAATLAKATNTDVSSVESKLAGLSADDYKSVMGTALAGGRDLGGAAARDVYRGSEERYRSSTRRSALNASRDEIESIKTDMSKMEESWGITSTKGKEEIQKLVMGGRTAGELLSIMYRKEEGNLSEDKKKAWRKRIVAQTAKEMELKETDPKVQQRMLGYMTDSGGIEMSKEVTKGLNKALESNEGFQDFASYVAEGTGMQVSQMSVSAVAGIAEDLGLTEGTIKTGQDLFSLSPDQMGDLAKSSKYGKIGKLLLKRRDATGGDQEDLTSQVEQALGTMGSESGGSESMFGGFGDTIMRLLTSDKKLSEVADQMSEAFKDFNPETTRSFREGAIALNEAMNNGTLRSGQG